MAPDRKHGRADDPRGDAVKLTAEQFKALVDVVGRADYAIHQLEGVRDEVTQRVMGNEKYAHLESVDLRTACRFARQRLTTLLEDIAALERTCEDKETP